MSVGPRVLGLRLTSVPKRLLFYFAFARALKLTIGVYAAILIFSTSATVFNEDLFVVSEFRVVGFHLLPCVAALDLSVAERTGLR